MRIKTILLGVCLAGLGGVSAFAGWDALPENCEKISVEKVDGSRPVDALCQSDGYLYSAGGGVLSIFRTKGTFQKTGELRGLPSWGMRQMAVRKGYAYITARHWGLVIADVRNPGRPRLVKVMPTEELATGIAVRGNALYVTMRIYGIEVFDLSDPESPRHVNLVRSKEAQSVFCSGPRMAAGDWGSSSVMLFDLSNPAVPEQVSELPLDGFGDGVFMDGSLLYASTGHNSRRGTREQRYGRGHGMEIFDLSDLRKPVRLGGVKFPRYYELGNDFWSVQVSGNTAYCTDTSNGLYTVEVRDKKNPKILRAFRFEPSKRNPSHPECITSLALADGMVYFGGAESGLFRFADKDASPLVCGEESVPPVERPESSFSKGLTRHETGGPVRRIAASGDVIYAAMMQHGIKSFRIRPDGSLKETGACPGKTVFDVAVSRDLLAAAEGSDGLGVYRIRPDQTLTEIGRFRKPGCIPLQYVRFYENGTMLSATGGRGESTSSTFPTRPVRFSGSPFPSGESFTATFCPTRHPPDTPCLPICSAADCSATPFPAEPFSGAQNPFSI